MIRFAGQEWLRRERKGMYKQKKNTISRVFSMACCPKGKYTIGIILSAGGILLAAVPFYAIYRIVEGFLFAAAQETVFQSASAFTWAGVTVGSIAAGIGCTIGGSCLCHASVFDALYRLRLRIMEHMGKLSMGFFTDGRAGATQKMMEDNVEKMESIMAHTFPNVVGAALLLAALAALMFYLNVWLAITVFAALGIAFAIQFSAFGGSRGQKNWANLNKTVTDLDASFSEYVSGMEEEKIFGHSKAAASKLTELIEKTRQYWAVYLKRVTPIFGAYKTITLSLLAFILAAGTILVLNHPGDQEMVSQILTFLIIGPAAMNPLMELVEMGSDLQNLSVKMDQIDNVFDCVPMVEPQNGKTPKGADIVFHDVSFSYQPASDPLRRMALDHVSMKIPSGSFAALVGPSGGGKTTAGQLLARFWDIERGSISIGGVDLRDMKTGTLMDQVAFVFQDTHIFAQSAFDNIAMGRQASRAQVEEAARAARCHDFIAALPQGYDTHLGDGGHKLSGGEAQRIAIARAILKNAPIVVLDEAMAFTDAENELALRQAMEELLQGKTVLMIAHRLYSIKDADHIFVLSEGKVAEEGKHGFLLEKNGLYAHLWKIQSESEQWSMKGVTTHA